MQNLATRIHSCLVLDSTYILAYLVFWGFSPLLSSTYLKLIQQKQADTRILAVHPLLTSHVFQRYKEIYSPNLQIDTFEVIQCHITTGDGDPSSPCSQGSCFCYHTTILYFSTLSETSLQFLSFSPSNTVHFLANMILLSLDAFFTLQIQFLISSDIYGFNPCWITEESSANLQLTQKMSIFFVVSCLLHSSCHISLINNNN